MNLVKCDDSSSSADSVTVKEQSSSQKNSKSTDLETTNCVPANVLETVSLPGPSNTGYFSSSDESEPYENSEDEYVPTDLEEEDEQPDSDQDDEYKSDLEYDHERETDGDITQNTPSLQTDNAKVVWGPCSDDVPNNFIFSDESGIKVDNIDLSKPYLIYRNFLTDEILDVIVDETNRYATEYISNHQLRPRSFIRKWTPTNRQEIKQLFGILMIMGISHVPKMRMYWSKNEMFGNTVIQKAMKRDRFDCLLKFLHFCNNAEPAARVDRL